MEATVFVVDDNPGVRKSLRGLMRSVGLRVDTFATIEEFLDAYDPDRPGCLVLDLRLRGGRTGLELQDELMRRGATLPVIILTGHPTVPASVRALRQGAFDFLVKPVPPQRLIERVRQALKQDRQIRSGRGARAAVAAAMARLTTRERQVMELLVAGRTSKQMAVKLGLSVRTIEGHRRRVLEKMAVDSAAQLLAQVLGSATW